TYKLRVAMAYNREAMPRNKVARPKPVISEQRNLDNGNNKARQSYAEALRQGFDRDGRKKEHPSNGVGQTLLQKMVFTVQEEEIE
ncbi:hypothetical protein Ancab_022948, partial [Ancistrocladus abbreviatus]